MSRRDGQKSGCLGKIVIFLLILGALGTFGGKLSSDTSSTTRSNTSTVSTSSSNSNSTRKPTAARTATPTPEEKAKAAEEEKNAYINSCKTVQYKDVERNPSQYKGERIKVTGNVIQVTEGWFSTVTLRVNESGTTNTWYITYKRSNDTEPRILENDRITLYGECTGVESYTSVIGSKITLPAMDAKYYK